MRILLLGGTRFIGPAVVRALQQRGHDVTIFHRGQTTPLGQPELHGVEYVHGDRHRLADHAAALRQLQPDAIVDMIPLSARDAQAVVNVFRGYAGHLVAISSMDVYRAFSRINRLEPGPPEPIPFTEDAPLRERLYPYRLPERRAADDPGQWKDNYDKIDVERIVLNHPDLPGTALRLPFVFGPGDNQRRLYPYVKRMDDGRPAIALGASQSRWQVSRVYVDNAAEAVACAVGRTVAFGKAYNVADDNVFTEHAWVAAVAEAAGWSGRIVIVPDDDDFSAPDYTQHFVLDTTRIREELGYVDRIGLEEALARTNAWDRAYPPTNFPPLDYAAEDKRLAEAGS